MRRLVAIAWLLAQSLPAQSIAARHYSEADGVPHQVVVDIEQTGDGCIWVSTSDGIARYDSATWQPVDPGLPYADGLRAVYRPLLATDEHGELWVFSPRVTHGVARLVDGQWQLTPGPPGTRSVATAAMASRRGDRRHALVATNDTLFRLDDGRWTSLPSSFGRIHAVVRHRADYAIASQNGAALLSIANPSDVPRPIPGLPAGEVLACAVDPRDDTLWLLSQSWLARLGDELTVQDHPVHEVNLSGTLPPALAPDGLGGVLFGSRFGLWRYAEDAGVTGLSLQPDVGTLALMRDREGFIWAAGVRGVAQFGGDAILNYSRNDGLADTEVSAILQLRDGRIVLGHDSQLTVLDDPVRRLRIPKASTFTRVMAMVEGPDGRILAACNQRGLLAIDPDTGSVERFTRGGLADMKSVQYVSKNERGDVLVTDYTSAGWLRNGEFVPAAVAVTGATDYVREAIPDGDGVLFTTNRHGLRRVSSTGMRTWRGDSVASNDLVCAIRQPNGQIWVGARAGALLAADIDTLQPLRLGGRTITQPVYAITNDQRGCTWFATDDGVYRWDGEHLIHMSQDDGLAGRETNRGALLCARDGRIWVGFASGASVINPERLPSVTSAPTIEFLPPLVNGRPFAGTRCQSQDLETVTFRLRAISMRDRTRLQIQHRLEGATKTWSELQQLPNREIRFSGLPIGRYRLHVRAIDSNGLVSEAVSPWLDVVAPWWRTPWFFALAIALLALIAIGAMRLVHDRRYARRLERDVHERTRDLAAERSRLAATMANIADGVILVDADGLIALWNETAERLTGWSSRQAVGRHLTDLLPAFAPDRDQDQAAPATTEIVLADGRRRWFEHHAATLANGGGRVIAFRDVTEKRTQERLLSRADRLESLGVLAGGIAHDFNNLLTVILGNADLIAMSDGDASAEYADSIRSAVTQAQRLTQQLLTFSKGGAPVRERQALLDVVTDSVRLALSGANVACDISAADDLRDAEFDRGQIAQVVHNLVLNAQQAMPDGGSITVTLYNCEQLPTGVRGSFVAIEVRDRGSGIPADSLDRIFDPYFTTKPGGSGLGLATAHSIVTRHGGVLTASSEPGLGSAFTIYLPALHDTEERDNEQRAQNADHPGSAPTPRRILCMDDNESVRRVLQTALAGMGHDVTMTADGAAAIAAFRSARATGRAFDLVLLDLTVPGGLGGIETLRELRRIDPNTVAIATTGYSTEPVLAEFERHGFRSTLRKPFTITDIHDALLRAMQGHAK